MKITFNKTTQEYVLSELGVIKATSKNLEDLEKMSGLTELDEPFFKKPVEASGDNEDLTVWLAPF